MTDNAQRSPPDEAAVTAQLLADIMASGKGDFPAVGKFLSDVQAALRSENMPVHQIASLILKDFALTNSILKLVNSAFYGASATRRISTISRAVSMLGMSTIANLAIALNVFEAFNGQAGVNSLKKLTIHTLLTGVHARELTRGEGLDPETAFIAGMMSNLGRLVTSFYFPERQVQIEKLVMAYQLDENEASRRVLGVPYSRLGVAVAKAWHFPETISEAIGGFDATEMATNTQEQKLRAIIAYADDLSSAATIADPKERLALLRKLNGKYANFINLDEQQLGHVLTASSNRLGDLTQALRISRRDLELHAPAVLQRGTMFIEKASQKLAEEQVSAAAAQSFHSAVTIVDPAALPGTLPGTLPVAHGQGGAALPAAAGGEAPAASGSNAANAAVPDAEALRRQRVEIFDNALNDISSAIAAETPLNDILMMILEGMYRGIGLDHVLLALITPDRTMLKGRFALGARWEELTQKFQIRLINTSSLLPQVITASREIVVPDVQVTPHIPLEFLLLTQAKSFMLLPILVKNVPIGAIYGQRVAGEEPINEQDQRNMRLLRNHASMAIRQCR